MPEHISLKHIFNEHAAIPAGVRYGAQGNAPISWVECVEIFNSFAGRPGFDYYDDGCYARAHVICRSLEDQGIAPGKIWAFSNVEHVGELKFTDPIWAYIDQELGRHVAWNYHVAVCLPVLLENDQVQNVVLDPTLVTGPTTVAHWQEILHARDWNIEIVPFGSKTLTGEADYSLFTKTTQATDYIAEKTITKQAGYEIRLPFSKQQSVLMKGHG